MFSLLLAATLLASSPLTAAHADEPALLELRPNGTVRINGLDLGGFDTAWNECDGNLTGNYIGLPCSKVRGMDNVFLQFLRDNMFQCVNAGVKAAGVKAGPAAAIHLLHDGTLADSNHNKTSLHAAGRAVDIMALTATYASGGRTTFDFRVTSSQPDGMERKFYEAFRACWGAIHNARNCPKREDGFPIGTMGWEDKRHIGHHLHTSMPFCPDNSGYARTSVPFDMNY